MARLKRVNRIGLYRKRLGNAAGSFRARIDRSINEPNVIRPTIQRPVLIPSDFGRTVPGLTLIAAAFITGASCSPTNERHSAIIVLCRRTNESSRPIMSPPYYIYIYIYGVFRSKIKPSRNERIFVNDVNVVRR